MISLAALIAVIAIYLRLLGLPDPSVLRPSSFDYHTLLAGSLLEGRVDITPREKTLDLALFNERYYLYWGPAPALSLVPIHALVGEVSDRTVACVLGALSLLVWVALLAELARQRIIQLSTSEVIAGGFFSAAGTLLFFCVWRGGVWYLSHQFAFFYSSIALWLLARSALGGRFWRLTWFGAILAFGFACLSRVSMFLLYPFFVACALGVQWRSVFLFDKRESLRLLGGAALACAMPLMVQLSYDYVRFGDPWESGQRYQAQSARFKAREERYGNLSTQYVAHNVRVYLVNPVRYQLRTPHVIYDRNGNALWSYQFDLWIIVLFLLSGFLAAVRRSLRGSSFRLLLFDSPRQRNVFLACLVAWAGYFVMLLHLFATGFSTFGGRYLIDILPCALIMVAIAYSNIRQSRLLCSASMLLLLMAVTVEVLVIR